MTVVIRYVVAMMVAILISGCFEDKTLDPVLTITGRVTYLGEPVSEGEVTFRDNETGKASSARLSLDGSFEMPCVVGVYDVAILPPPFEGGMDDNGKELPAPPAPENIPEPYRRFETSGFTAMVLSETEIDFLFAME